MLFTRPPSQKCSSPMRTGWEHSWKCTRRKYRLDQVPLLKPVLSGTFDAGRHALERHGEVLESLRWQSVTQQPTKCAVAV
jgi:hypothetical protein